MNSVNTPEQLENALTEICAMRGIDMESKRDSTRRNYSQNQARLRDLEERRIASGETDSEGRAIFIKNKQQPTPEQLAGAKRNAKKTNFNRAFVAVRGEQ